ncbi:MAG: bifunctional diaminohydroxyphosphoribosylaminopyrimidine deaminase/5-amino-6-(5-phosphoribosylamino)uracil reductase RibD [Planctomycetota bacterium]
MHASSFEGGRDELLMRRALELAGRGAGRVEPNPMVGAVIEAAGGGGRIIAEGWHADFGGPHAEIAALAAAGDAARGGTLAVTLEPCCHQGKTPPCTAAIIAAGIARVIVATPDPFPAVSGGGINALRQAGIDVTTAVCAAEARRLIAPFSMLVQQERPWLIAKWAMSLDGRVATAARESRWISSAASREIVHELRGRMDGILCGIGTALADDPLLTARPAGPRQAVRIVLDGAARLPVKSRLVRTARDRPVLVAVGPAAPANRLQALEAAGCEVWRGAAADLRERLTALLTELAVRRLTNVLIEGGPQVLGSFADAGLIDEVWAFIAPMIIGGAAAPPAVGGTGSASLLNAAALDIEHVGHPGGDLFVRGVVRRDR